MTATDPPWLPAGWTHHTDGSGPYYRRIIARTAHVDVASDGMTVTMYGDWITVADRALSLGVAVTEAAEILAEIQAGIR